MASMPPIPCLTLLRNCLILVFVVLGGHRHYGQTPGTTVWSAVTDPIRCPPLISPDSKILIGLGTALWALRSDGRQAWAYTTGDQVLSSPAVGNDCTIYFGSYDRNLYALDFDGKKRWNFLCGGAIYSSPAVGRDGTVYVGCFDGKLYAVGPNGAKKWDVPLGSEVRSSPA